MKPTRLLALNCLEQVLKHHKSLNDVLDALPETHPEGSLIRAICYGVLRWYWQGDFILQQLLQKPLKDKDQDIYLLLLIGIFSLKHLGSKAHASTNETVKICKHLKKDWAKGLVNAVLRNYLRQHEKLDKLADTNEQARLNHPNWLIKMIKTAWPEDFEKILSANNQQGPMIIRANSLQTSVDDYLQQLSNDNITAEKHPISGIHINPPISVFKLPKFKNGAVSVQDASAQLAAILLSPKNGETILDACAAPGGKTGHLLELAPQCQLTAIDISAKRTEKITENLQRLKLKATVITADTNEPNTWHNKQAFDKILCDAPCSATGVIRRHPDIKHLRKQADIKALAQQQLRLLKTLWSLLKPGGTLLYCTCSVLPDENDVVISEFLSSENTANCQSIQANWGHATLHGRQVLPGENNMDGFYYCLLVKNA